MADDTRTTLRLFREFVLMNATQWRLGAAHQHPMWARVAKALGDDNGTPMTDEEFQQVHPDAASVAISSGMRHDD